MEDVFTGWGDFAYLGAIAVPIVVGLLTKASLSGFWKFLLALLLCVIVGVITVWRTTGTWEWSVPFILSIVGAAEVFYRVIIKPTGIGDWLASKLNKDPPPTQ